MSYGINNRGICIGVSNRIWGQREIIYVYRISLSNKGQNALSTRISKLCPLILSPPSLTLHLPPSLHQPSPLPHSTQPPFLIHPTPLHRPPPPPHSMEMSVSLSLKIISLAIPVTGSVTIRLHVVVGVGNPSASQHSWITVGGGEDNTTGE